MKENFGFIIPSYCSNEIHLFQLKRCINSIRKFHNGIKIIIIDDYSEINLSKNLSEYDNILILLSTIKSAGDMSTYKIFLDNPIFQKAVIMQDSMTLEKELDIEKIDTISYLWYFTNHRLHWHIIEEPQNEYNIKKGIKVHDDAIIDIINNYILNIKFKEFAQKIYFDKNKWSGCFGCLSIIDYDFLKVLDEKTGIINLLLNFNNNRLRRVAESIFALAVKYVLGDEIFEKAYDGLYYDGINEPNGRITLNAKSLGLPINNIVNQVCKNTYFSKISFDRRS